jgi:hypothetical protein
MAEEVKKKERKREEKPLEKMTVKELRAIAMEIPRSIAVHDMRKEELIAFIKEAREVKDERRVEPVKDKEKRVVSKAEMKRRIKELKEEKREAQTARDRKKIEFLRRRISHLKKKTRRFAHA